MFRTPALSDCWTSRMQSEGSGWYAFRCSRMVGKSWRSQSVHDCATDNCNSGLYVREVGEEVQHSPA